MASRGRPCEHQPGCNARARWHVRRVNRRTDGQDSCGRHLAATVDALEEGDGSAILVEPLEEDGENR